MTIENLGVCPTVEQLKERLEQAGINVVIMKTPTLKEDGRVISTKSYAAESMGHVVDYMRDGSFKTIYLYMTEPYVTRIMNWNVITTFKVHGYME